MIIEQVKQPSLADVVEQKIRDAIVNSGLKPGDKLPGELEFAEKLGVSRNIVREALSRLRMLGVLESKKRRGLILTEPKIFRGLDTILSLPVLNEQTKYELFQIRVISEIGMASLVFDKKTDEDIATLEAIVQKEEANPSNFELNVECDVAFHTRLFEMLGNKTMTDLESLLKPFISRHVDDFLSDRFERGDEFSNHRTLLDALKGDSKEGFVNEMKRHLSHYL